MKHKLRTALAVTAIATLFGLSTAPAFAESSTHFDGSGGISAEVTYTADSFEIAISGVNSSDQTDSIIYISTGGVHAKCPNYSLGKMTSNTPSLDEWTGEQEDVPCGIAKSIQSVTPTVNGDTLTYEVPSSLLGSPTTLRIIVLAFGANSVGYIPADAIASDEPNWTDTIARVDPTPTPSTSPSASNSPSRTAAPSESASSATTSTSASATANASASQLTPANNDSDSGSGDTSDAKLANTGASLVPLGMSAILLTTGAGLLIARKRHS